MVDPTAADSDGVVPDTKCSLREAVLSVNRGVDVGDCRAVVTEAYGTNDAINLPAGTYTLTLAGLDETYDSGKPPTDYTAVVNAPDASKGDLDLINNVTIVGAGSEKTRIHWDPAATSSAGADRIFHVFNAADFYKALVVGIQGVTLANGKTFEVDVGPGPTPGTNYYLRRAGGALAVGQAAAIVLVDPSLPDQENIAGRGGSKPETTALYTGTSYIAVLGDVIVEDSRAQGDGGGIYTAGGLIESAQPCATTARSPMAAASTTKAPLASLPRPSAAIRPKAAAVFQCAWLAESPTKQHRQLLWRYAQRQHCGGWWGYQQPCLFHDCHDQLDHQRQYRLERSCWSEYLRLGELEFRHDCQKPRWS